MDQAGDRDLWMMVIKVELGKANSGIFPRKAFSAII